MKEIELKKWGRAGKTQPQPEKKSTNYYQANSASVRTAALVNAQNNPVSAQGQMDLNDHLWKCQKLLIPIIRMNTLIISST